jgi:hypothetical protein
MRLGSHHSSAVGCYSVVSLHRTQAASRAAASYWAALVCPS